MNITWQDLSFFLTRLKSLPVSKSIALGEKGFCVSTGSDLDSWVFYPERINNIEVVESAVKFFKENKISFMWPVYDGGEKFLEKAGLFYAGSLTGMIYSPQYMGEPNIERTLKRQEWAKTSWQAFGGEAGKVPENYYKLAEAFRNEPSFSIYAYPNGIKDKYNDYWGTALLVNEPNATGVYYFATVPEMRRQGIAKSMMNTICVLSQGRRILLQATPAGLPFYKSYGFEELCKIPVYSDKSDVF